MKRALFSLLVLLVLMTGCKTRTEITFNEDGSGTFGSYLEMSTQELRLLSKEGNPIDTLVANAQSVSFPVEIERTDENNVHSFRASFRFSDIADMQTKLTELNQNQGESSTLFKDAEVSNTDDGWTFEAESGSVDTQDAPAIDQDELDKLIDAQITVTLPGEEGENNATSVDASEESTTYTWKVSPGKPIQLSAATVFPDTWLDKLLSPVGLGIAAVVLALIAFVVLRLRKARAG